MNYEQKYKQALKRAKHIYQFSSDLAEIKRMEEIFPELKESEDERIREAIKYGIKYLETEIGWDFVNNVDILDIYAWLEKQGEQKSVTIDIDKMVDDYANNNERGNEEFGKPVNCMIRAYRQGLNDAVGEVVLKSSWSEEDERMLNQTLKTAYAYGTTKMIDWLKSLKQRMGEISYE